MTQSDKDMLLKDLSSRLTYDIIVRVSDDEYGEFDSYINSISTDGVEILPENGSDLDSIPYAYYRLEKIKPYLRTVLSMTEEEMREYKHIIENIDEMEKFIGKMKFYNKHHFDYRGLIDKGLALEAPDGMYNF